MGKSLTIVRYRRSSGTLIVLWHAPRILVGTVLEIAYQVRLAWAPSERIGWRKVSVKRRNTIPGGEQERIYNSEGRELSTKRVRGCPSESSHFPLIKEALQPRSYAVYSSWDPIYIMQQDTPLTDH